MTGRARVNAGPWPSKEEVGYGMLRRSVCCLGIVAFLFLAAAQENAGASISELVLPGENVFPEGIALAPDGRIFVGSSADGTIFAGSPDSEELSVFVEGGSEGSLDAAFGMTVDGMNRLWVAGGPTGTIGVFDTETGENIRTIQAPAAENGTFLNDLVEAPDGYVYITDSARPVLFRARSNETEVGDLEAWLDLTDSPIDYSTAGQGPAGTNLNGIVVTEDGSHLLTIDMNDGLLYRIALESGEVSEVDLGGESLLNGDGLVVDGQTLYVVRLTENEVVTVELGEEFASGTVTARFSDPALHWPATAALVEGRLYLVNTQFDRRQQGNPELPFAVATVPVDVVAQGGGAAEPEEEQPAEEAQAEEEQPGEEAGAAAQEEQRQEAEQPGAEEDEVAGGGAAQGEPAPEASAQLTDSDGNNIGIATFAVGQDGAVSIEVEITGLTAAAEGAHGIHIHETGRCEAPSFESAGGHFNPGDKQHGLENPEGPHAGDLPNIEIDGEGNARYETTNDRISLAVGETSILDDDGSALVIHASRDDQVTDPGGNSGDRIACGVIGANGEDPRAQASQAGGQDGIRDYSPVTEERLREPEPGNWLMWMRTYDASGFSPLDQITAENVSELEPVWTYSTGLSEGHEAPPIVNDGVMFVSTPENHVIALDAATGDLLWRYERDLPHDLFQLHPTNRGVGLYDDKVFLATLDTYLVALDARSGEVLWERGVEDFRDGYYMTLAPLIANGKVMVGVSGGELGVRGFVQAFDAETGDSAWKTYTIPAPGEPGNDSWPGNTWEQGGGSVWITGSYDPELNLSYWGTGNAAPWTGDARPGDNLYTTSVIALDVDSGELRGHFQYHWNDSWDWDEVATPLLIDFERDGETVRGLMHAARNGYLWWLERREDGIGFVDGQPYVDQNVFENLDPETGRPEYDEEHKPAIGQEATFCPSLWGGKDWPPAAFNPETRLIYIPANENHCGRMTGIEEEYVAGQTYFGASSEFFLADGADHVGELQAWNVDTGEQEWVHEFQGSHTWGPVMTTGGSLVFTGGTNDRFFRAFDAETGEVLWQHRTNSGINGVPVSFEVDGVQYVAVQSGWGVDAVRFQSAVAGDQGGHWNQSVPQGGVIWVFALEDAASARAESQQQVEGGGEAAGGENGTQEDR
jgi:alcohol dehydrogenase (cytochrome c)